MPYLFIFILYSQTCLERPPKNRQNEGLKDMPGKSIAEVSKAKVLQNSEAKVL